MPLHQPGHIPVLMAAMRIHRISELDGQSNPLVLEELPVPVPGSGEVLVKISACGVCHTELDEIEGRTPPRCLPMTPGHQVTGKVIAQGPDCETTIPGGHIGVAWIYSACGVCGPCRSGLENLCASFTACGRDENGGYAQYMLARENFIHPLPDSLNPVKAAPLLCAGSVGYRALMTCGLSNGQALGLTGFGASGHLVLQMAKHLYPDSHISVHSRNPAEQAFARELGADWAGDTEDPAPVPAAAIIDTTPAWKPVRAALEDLAPGGRLVINAIRKENADQGELLKLSYERHLWQEKSIKSVANVTRKDVRACLELSATIPLKPEITTYSLEQAGDALNEIKRGGLRGAKVLVLDH